jgi:TPR repeat protein
MTYETKHSDILGERIKSKLSEKDLDDMKSVIGIKNPSPDSLYKLAMLYKVGLHVTKNVNKAIELCTLAASKGHIEAQKHLGFHFYCADINDDSNANKKQAFKWYLMAAAQGDAESKGMIGYMYHHGYGTSVNLDHAICYYLDAIEHGYTRAQHDLGLLYFNGPYKDDYEAFKWFMMGALRENFHDQEQLGYLYSTTTTELKNNFEAFKWLKTACDNEQSQKCFLLKLFGSLGHMYEYGLGTDINILEAIRYYKLAAAFSELNNIIKKNPDIIATIILDSSNELDEQKKKLFIQKEYIEKLEYMPEGPKYKETKDHFYLLSQSKS